MARNWNGGFSMMVVLFSAFSGAENHTDHRSKRYIYINKDSPVTLGFLLNVAIAVALPNFIDTTPRSLDYDTEERMPGFEYPEDLSFEPAYEQELGRLLGFFAYLKLPMVECQERIVCEMAAEPETYSPLSVLVLKELRQTHGLVKPSHESLMWRYVAATARGHVYGTETCVKHYGKCEMSARQRLNMVVLKLYQYYAAMLKIKLL
ncbi:uncharacterized protein LOC108670952 [Hyalella azteca]|uniref:Uncharacterized protein LOC108670952 n=1 Tax=Hyalella azteca TaxID=294128 RepID=A0A8B7NKY6_HYAAZ|nr:uncharacterized protein LOC108670952 [Hyalella azteca]